MSSARKKTGFSFFFYFIFCLPSARSPPRGPQGLRKEEKVVRAGRALLEDTTGPTVFLMGRIDRFAFRQRLAVSSHRTKIAALRVQQSGAESTVKETGEGGGREAREWWRAARRWCPPPKPGWQRADGNPRAPPRAAALCQGVGYGREHQEIRGRAHLPGPPDRVLRATAGG